jgi:glycosyltransferase involved in cell wall biosynthesis
VLLGAARLGDGGGRKSGNYYHVVHLVRALASRDDVDLVVLADDDSYDDLRTLVDDRSVVRASVGGSVVRRDLALVRAVHRVRPDIFHKPTGALPTFPLPCRTIAGIADLNFTVLPTRVDKRIYKELTHRWTVRTADHITCVSEYTRQAVLSYLNADPAAVSVIHHGANELTGRDDGMGRELRSTGGPYWLAFAQHPHKNAETLFQVLAESRAQGGDGRLVLVGNAPYVGDTLRPMVSALGLGDAVVFAGAVTSGTLRGLYEQSEGLLFPSTYEGFGLPILEAMALGCPVIASNICSLPEVAGDAAILVGPRDVRAILAGVRQLRSEARRVWIERGLTRARLFTWQRAADETVALYARLGPQVHRRDTALIPASRAVS